MEEHGKCKEKIEKVIQKWRKEQAQYDEVTMKDNKDKIIKDEKMENSLAGKKVIRFSDSVDEIKILEMEKFQCALCARKKRYDESLETLLQGKKDE